MITFLLTLIVTALTFPRNFVDRSVKRRRADDKSKKHKPTCSVAVNNAKDAKDSEEGKLEQVEKNYAVHLWRFNFIMKGLRIILNDNFIKLALFHESEARRSTNKPCSSSASQGRVVQRHSGTSPQDIKGYHPSFHPCPEQSLCERRQTTRRHHVPQRRVLRPRIH